MAATLLAFLQRDLSIAVTYRVSLAQSLAVLFLGLLSMNFVSRFVEEGAPPSLAVYENDYFGYALVGAALALFVQAVVRLFPSAVRGAQVTGTLEVILASGTPLPLFLAGSVLYGLAFALVRLCLALAIGAIVLGARIEPSQSLLALGALSLTTAAFAGVGILAAAFVLWFKQQEPFTGLLLTLSLLLSGIVYPTTVLPDWLQSVAQLLPLTHAVEVLRQTLLLGRGLDSVLDDLALLGLFSLLLPVGAAAFSFCLRRARADGTLGHY